MIVPPNPVARPWRPGGAPPPGAPPRGAMPPGATPRPHPAAFAAPPREGYDVSPLAAWLVAGCVFFSTSRLGSTFDVLEPLRLTLVFSALAFVIMLASVPRWKPHELARHWIAKLVLVLLLIMILGIATSIFPTRTIFFIRDAFVRTLAIAVMVWGVARTPKGTRLMAKTIALGSTTAAGLALWRGRHEGSGRLLGAATYDSNDLALVINIAIPLAMWWMMDKRSRMRWVMLPALPILLYASIETGSRGGFLGLGAILASLFYLAFRGGVPRLRPVAKWLLAVSIIGFPLLPSSYRERVTGIFSDTDYNFSSPRGRINVWKRGLGYTARNPLLGVGAANFRTAEGRLSDYAIARGGSGVKWSTAHNSYLQTLAELGIPGGIIFFVLIVRTFWTLLTWRSPPRAGPHDAAEDLFPPMLALSFAAYAVSGFFLSFAYNDNAYFMLALAAATLMRAPGAPAAAAARPGMPVRPGFGTPPAPGGMPPAGPRGPFGGPPRGPAGPGWRVPA